MKINIQGNKAEIKNKTIWLTNTQSKLLKLLCNSNGKIVTYKKISNSIYKIECDDLLKSLIKKHISLLRKKIEKDIRIRNISGVGYIIEEDLK